jgi:hypothetical protein
MNIQRLLAIVCLSILCSNLKTQTNTDQVYVDDNGVMRWSVDKSELHGFGVNYTLPFAHEYRMAKKTGFPLEDAIRQDVYHMARLAPGTYNVTVDFLHNTCSFTAK